MAINTEQIRSLRESTGAGMMDCKKALEETNGNTEKAVDYLRKKGAAVAAKRADRAAEQGVVEAYIHAGGRVGTLVEINCESDFVARTEEFRALARDIAMQVTAMNPMVVSREQLDQSILERELDIYRTQARNEGKPEPLVEKIAQGRLEKFFQEVCLIEQTFIKDSGRTIRDLVNEAMAKTGERVSIRRFQRYYLGETT
ncbi:MAG: translation elongation factor Ts [Ignavibacteriales bacterium CG07_land_8_20_14_0_80_59_12]|nr:MAG: translation elongation factor Ts [Ignavibacteriales bacterium CG07_land_8_20_14_0_80_59_12]